MPGTPVSRSPAASLAEEPAVLNALVRETWRDKADFLHTAKGIAPTVPTDLLELLHAAFALYRGAFDSWLQSR
jgi:hypothetical protein